MDNRVTSLEETDVQMIAKLQALEASVVQTPPPNVNEWPAAVHEYLLRNVEFAVVYTPQTENRHRYILPVANGCLMGDDYVLTCSEALELANNVASGRRGRVIVLCGLMWCYFDPEPADEATGLVLCKITGRDEERWKATREKLDRLSRKYDQLLATKSPKWTIAPWLGQEVGFILASDSEDNMRQFEFTRVEFGTAVISHFRLPKENALKVFVTGVFAGRISQVGSAVFSRDGTLLGIISGVENYAYDAGRRAVVKTLLGFPRFTIPKVKPSAQAGDQR
jgi:hypothetical protein